MLVESATVDGVYSLKVLGGFDTGTRKTHPAMDIVVLSLFIEGPRSFLAVDHTASHGDGVGHDALKEAVPSTGSQGVNPTLGEGKIDGPCEVQWCC